MPKVKITLGHKEYDLETGLSAKNIASLAALMSVVHANHGLEIEEEKTGGFYLQCGGATSSLAFVMNGSERRLFKTLEEAVPFILSTKYVDQQSYYGVSNETWKEIASLKEVLPDVKMNFKDLKKEVAVLSWMEQNYIELGTRLLESLYDRKLLDFAGEDGIYSLKFRGSATRSWKDGDKNRRFITLEEILSFVLAQVDLRVGILDSITDTDGDKTLLRIIDELYPELYFMPEAVQVLARTLAVRIAASDQLPTAKLAAARKKGVPTPGAMLRSGVGFSPNRSQNQAKAQYECIQKDLRNKGELALYKCSPAGEQAYYIVIPKGADPDHMDERQKQRVTEQELRSNIDDNNVFAIWDNPINGIEVQFYIEPGHFYPAEYMPDETTASGVGVLIFQDKDKASHTLYSVGYGGNWHEHIDKEDKIDKCFPGSTKKGVAPYYFVEKDGKEFVFADSKPDKRGNCILQFKDPTSNKTIEFFVPAERVKTLPKGLTRKRVTFAEVSSSLAKKKL